MQEKYLKVAEMGVEAETPEKLWRVEEVPPKESEKDKRNRMIDELSTLTATRRPAPIVGEAVSSVMQLNKTSALIDGYEGWKLLAFYMAGKLSVYESMEKKGDF